MDNQSNLHFLRNSVQKALIQPTFAKSTSNENILKTKFSDLTTTLKLALKAYKKIFSGKIKHILGCNAEIYSRKQQKSLF